VVKTVAQAPRPRRKHPNAAHKRQAGEQWPASNDTGFQPTRVAVHPRGACLADRTTSRRSRKDFLPDDKNRNLAT
jgi:hypothetical protein